VRFTSRAMALTDLIRSGDEMAAAQAKKEVLTLAAIGY